jgi:sulfur carrier protein
MKVNGKETTLGEVCTLLEFLTREGYIADRIAVEKNGEVVPRARHDSEILCDSDKLEIVTFVGGG